LKETNRKEYQFIKKTAKHTKFIPVGKRNMPCIERIGQTLIIFSVGKWNMQINHYRQQKLWIKM